MIRVAILIQGRSGSTLLIHLLNKTAGVTCESEILSRERFADVHHELYRRSNDQDDVQKVYGFKFKTRHIELMQKYPLKEFCSNLNDRGWKIMTLFRRNQLRSVMSSYLSEALNRHKLWSHEHHLRETIPAIEVDLKELEQDLHNRNDDLYRIRNAVSAFETLDLEYARDLLQTSSRPRTFKKISDFIGYPLAYSQPDLIKMAPTDFSGVITNWSDVCRLIEKSRWSWMLADRE